METEPHPDLGRAHHGEPIPTAPVLLASRRAVAQGRGPAEAHRVRPTRPAGQAGPDLVRPPLAPHPLARMPAREGDRAPAQRERAPAVAAPARVEPPVRPV